MQRKRGGLVPIGEVFSDLSGPQSRRPVELADLLAEGLQRARRSVERRLNHIRQMQRRPERNYGPSR